jgi:hypothetical protein
MGHLAMTSDIEKRFTLDELRFIVRTPSQYDVAARTLAAQVLDLLQQLEAAREALLTARLRAIETCREAIAKGDERVEAYHRGIQYGCFEGLHALGVPIGIHGPVIEMPAGRHAPGAGDAGRNPDSQKDSDRLTPPSKIEGEADSATVGPGRQIPEHDNVPAASSSSPDPLVQFLAKAPVVCEACEDKPAPPPTNSPEISSKLVAVLSREQWLALMREHPNSEAYGKLADHDAALRRDEVFEDALMRNQELRAERESYRELADTMQALAQVNARERDAAQGEFARLMEERNAARAEVERLRERDEARRDPALMREQAQSIQDAGLMGPTLAGLCGEVERLRAEAEELRESYRSMRTLKEQYADRLQSAEAKLARAESALRLFMAGRLAGAGDAGATLRMSADAAAREYFADTATNNSSGEEGP